MDITPRDNDSSAQESTIPTVKYLLKRIWRRKVRDNKSALVLLVSFVVVCMWWFLQQLQNGQVISTTISPTYTSLPAGYTSSEISREDIKISVRMNNFNILSYMVGGLPLEVDMSAVVEKKDGYHFWVPKKYPSLLACALHDTDEIERVAEDTVFFNMGDETVKRVSVELSDVHIKPRAGYGIFSPVLVSPAQVKVIGPKNEIDAIDHINLPSLTYRGVSGELRDTVALTPPSQYKRIYFSPEEVVVSFVAEPYTEETVTLKVYPLNAPRGKKVVFIPSQVKVRYHVPIKNYGSVSDKDFRVEADLSTRSDTDENIIYLRLKSKPAYVGNVDILPEKVYYLIK